MAKKPSEMTPAERRAKMIRDRAARKTIKKSGTYDAVPSGRLTSRVQAMKDAADGRKGAKATSGTVVTFKDTGSGKGADPKGLFKPRPKTQANRAKSQGGRSAAEVAANRKKTPSTKSRDKDGLGTKAKSGAKKYNVGVSKGGVSFKEAFKYYRGQGNKTFTWNGKKYTTDVKKAAPKAKVSTPTPADFSTSAKKPAAKKAAPKSSTSSRTKARDLTLRDKGGISARRNAKGPLAKAREEFPVTGPGSQSKILRNKKR